MPLNIEELRQDTPGTASVIHFNNAGAALMPLPVIEAIQSYLEFELETGGYEAANQMADELHGFYTAHAKLLNAPPAQIAFVSHATEAYNRALSSIPFEREDVILTSLNDYVSNHIAFMQLEKRLGVKTIHAEELTEGGVDPDSLKALIHQHRPRLVAITHIPTNSGLIQDVETIGEFCRANEIWYLVDGCQAVGQLELDVNKIHCDFLSATSRKFMRGPRGAGFMYVSQRVLDANLEPLFMDLRSADWSGDKEYTPHPDASRYELWERSQAIVMGAKASAEYALKLGLATIEERVKQLAAYCRTQLRTIEKVQVLDRGSELGGIVTFNLPGWEPAQLQQALFQNGINTSYATLDTARYDFQQKAVKWALRISPHYYNTEAEINRCVEVLHRLEAR